MRSGRPRRQRRRTHRASPAAASKLFSSSRRNASPASLLKPCRSRRPAACRRGRGRAARRANRRHCGWRRLGELALSQSVRPCCSSPLHGSSITVLGSTRRDGTPVRAHAPSCDSATHPACPCCSREVPSGMPGRLGILGTTKHGAVKARCLFPCLARAPFLEHASEVVPGGAAREGMAGASACCSAGDVLAGLRRSVLASPFFFVRMSEGLVLCRPGGAALRL